MGFGNCSEIICLLFFNHLHHTTITNPTRQRISPSLYILFVKFHFSRRNEIDSSISSNKSISRYRYPKQKGQLFTLLPLQSSQSSCRILLPQRKGESKFVELYERYEKSRSTSRVSKQMDDMADHEHCRSFPHC